MSGKCRKGFPGQRSNDKVTVRSRKSGCPQVLVAGVSPVDERVYQKPVKNINDRRTEADI